MDTATALATQITRAAGRHGVLLAVIATAVLVVLAGLILTQPAAETMLASPFRWSCRV